MKVFNYGIDLQPMEENKISTDQFGSCWSIVEEFFLPESFVSNKGSFMFRIEENEKEFVDIWLLVIPSNIETLIKFLKQEITYGEISFNMQSILHCEMGFE